MIWWTIVHPSCWNSPIKIMARKKKQMIIRKEQKTDLDEIYKLIKTAFETAQVSNGKEQNFAVKLRKGESYIPELALVADDNGKLIGHIMLTKTYIKTELSNIETLLLAPISVDIEYRNQGVGSGLIKKSFEIARENGYKSVVLVGNPLYYSRFGFRSSVEFGIKNDNGIPDEYVMACEIAQDGLKNIKGLIKFETE